MGFVLQCSKCEHNSQPVKHWRGALEESLWKMREAVPLRIKLRFVAHDDCSKCEVSEAGIKCHLDLTLKVPFSQKILIMLLLLLNRK